MFSDFSKNKSYGEEIKEIVEDLSCDKEACSVFKVSEINNHNQ